MQERPSRGEATPLLNSNHHDMIAARFDRDAAAEMRRRSWRRRPSVRTSAFRLAHRSQVLS